MSAELTKEELELVDTVKNEWVGKFFSCPKLDKEKATEGINWLYEFCGYPKPDIHFVASPEAAQKLANELCGEKNTYYSFSVYGNVGDFSWCAYYDYFRKLGKIDNGDFDKYCELMNCGIFDTIQFDKACIVVGMPKFIKVDSQNRLHCEDGPVLDWEDSFKLYALFGVYFDEELYYNVINKKMTFKEVMGLDNIEQRMAALRIYGADLLLESADAELVNTSLRGNELYLVKDVFSSVAYFLKYTCPSTGRVYVSGVAPEVGAKKDADAAMAWKFGLKKNEYSCLDSES